MKTENIFVKWAFLVFVVAVPLACKQIGSLSSNSNSTGGATTTASPFERPLQLTEPRTLKYANLQFTVKKALISNRVADDQPQDNSNPALADITLSVVNTFKDAVGSKMGCGNSSLATALYTSGLTLIILRRGTRKNAR